MGFTMDQVVPWGRNMEEYIRMFSLSSTDLHKKILGCADGPASFNAELYQKGKCVVSVDPIYQFSAVQIRERIKETASTIAGQMEKNQQDYLWGYYQSPGHLLRIRLAAMDLFLSDVEKGTREGRYITGALPQLPFADQSFDLAICSYCLFSYSHQFDLDFHYDAITEMCRVGKEVRVFPLLEVDGKPSRHLQGVLLKLQQNHSLMAEIIKVDYEFQKGGSQMLLLQPK